MVSKEVRLRGNAQRRTEFYPLGDIPEDIIFRIGEHLAHRLAIGQNDISGDDFERIFADSVFGTSRASPLGIADVVKDKCAWSVKTVKHTSPFKASKIRLISGRNSPDYALGISDPRNDIAVTGEAVLKIWNARVNEAAAQFSDLRKIVLIRNFEKRQFVIFEEVAERFPPSNYRWRTNKGGNLEGIDKGSNEHCFTWQPTGGQFTIIKSVASNAKKFSLSVEVPVIPKDSVLQVIEYSNDWISILE